MYLESGRDVRLAAILRCLFVMFGHHRHHPRHLFLHHRRHHHFHYQNYFDVLTVWFLIDTNANLTWHAILCSEYDSNIARRIICKHSAINQVWKKWIQCWIVIFEGKCVVEIENFRIRIYSCNVKWTEFVFKSDIDCLEWIVQCDCE